jgi:hypothetical protein
MTKQPEAHEPDQPLALSSCAVLGVIVERVQAKVLAYASARVADATEDEPRFMSAKRARVKATLLDVYETLLAELSQIGRLTAERERMRSRSARDCRGMGWRRVR